MTKDKKRYLKILWTLLEAKYFYYLKPCSIHVRSDTWYDQLEDEYKVLAEKLGHTVDMSVGFPLDTPSGRMVASSCEKVGFKYTIDK